MDSRALSTVFKLHRTIMKFEVVEFSIQVKAFCGDLFLNCRFALLSEWKQLQARECRHFYGQFELSQNLKDFCLACTPSNFTDCWDEPSFELVSFAHLLLALASCILTDCVAPLQPRSYQFDLEFRQC